MATVTVREASAMLGMAGTNVSASGFKRGSCKGRRSGSAATMPSTWNPCGP